MTIWSRQPYHWQVNSILSTLKIYTISCEGYLGPHANSKAIEKKILRSSTKIIEPTSNKLITDYTVLFAE